MSVPDQNESPGNPAQSSTPTDESTKNKPVKRPLIQPLPNLGTPDENSASAASESGKISVWFIICVL